jgi:hypothetical protein
MSNWTVTYGGVTSEYVYSFSDEGMEVTEIAPPPEVPPEVWQTKPADGDRCMQAVRAMCG